MNTKKIFTTLISAGSICMSTHEADTRLPLDEPMERVRIQASRVDEPMEHTQKETTPPMDIGKYKTAITASGAAPIKVHLFDKLSVAEDFVSATASRITGKLITWKPVHRKGIVNSQSGGMFMAKHFDRAEVFPIIASSIQKIYRTKGDFVSHEEIVQSLLGDPAGKGYVEKAQQGENPRSAEYWAGVMVAHFSEAFTAGKSDYANDFERKKLGADWAYKPKAK